MSEQLTEIDILLLERWPDTVGIRDAIKELEGRLAGRLEATAQRLRPWLTERGYMMLDVDTKRAVLNVGKVPWMKTDEEALIYISVGALFPFGFRRNQEEHPYVWLMADGLPEDEQKAFFADVSNRVENRPGGWVNQECDPEWPVGRYIRSHRDPERAQLAQSDESLELFIKTELQPILALTGDFEAALEAIRSTKRPKGKE